MNFQALNSVGPKGHAQGSAPERGQKHQLSKEAQEAHALQLHLSALGHQKEGRYDEARAAFEELLEADFIHTASPGLLDQVALRLKYSSLKNLAHVAAAQGRRHTALQCYLQACELDQTDVTLLYCLATTAMELGDFMHARQALEKGYSLSPEHWPCLSGLCRVLFAIQDYLACYSVLRVALEKRPHYVEGLCYLKWIVQERPSIVQSSDQRQLTPDTDGEVFQRVMRDIADLRGREVGVSDGAAAQDQPPAQAEVRLAQSRWLDLGKALLDVYSQRSRSNVSVLLPVCIQEEAHAGDAASSEVEGACRAAPDAEVAGSTNGAVEQESPVKSGSKRRLLGEPSFVALPKRRSTRVQAQRRSAEAVFMCDCLKELLPATRNLLLSEDVLELSPVLALSALAAPPSGTSATPSGTSALPSGTSATPSGSSAVEVTDREGEGTSSRSLDGGGERGNVALFLSSIPKTSGLVDVLLQFVVALANMSHLRWPEELVQVFLTAVDKAARHTQLPATFGYPDEAERVFCEELTAVFVCYLELRVDQMCTSGKREDECFTKCLAFLHTTLPWMASKQIVTAIRLCWCLSHLAGTKKDDIGSLHWLTKCQEYLQCWDSRAGQIELPNCHFGPVITEGALSERQAAFQQSMALMQVRAAFVKGDHEQVAQQLLEALEKGSTTIGKLFACPEVGVSEEGLSWLEMLLTSLKGSEGSQDQVLRVCIEAMKHILVNDSCHDNEMRGLKTVLVHLDECTSGNTLELSPSMVGQVLLCVCKVIDLILDQPDSAVAAGVPVATPWMVLHRVLLLNKVLSDTPILDRPSDGGLPSDGELPSKAGLSLEVKMLSLAHQQLGSVGWCCAEGGRFLRLFLAVLRRPTGDVPTEVVVDEKAQCYHCLYGFPGRSPSGKKLSSHASEQQIPLTWKVALEVVGLFNLRTPSRQRQPTVSADVLPLYRKALSLMPEGLGQVVSLDTLRAILDGRLPHLPPHPSGDCGFSHLLSDMEIAVAEDYHRLGNYQSACEHYLSSLSCRPSSRAAWAGLALSQAERVLSVFEAVDADLTSDECVKRHMPALVRCFPRALENEETHGLMCFKFGVLACCVQDYMCRVLCHFSSEVSEELRVWAGSDPMVVLGLARQCFRELASCVEGTGVLRRAVYGVFLGHIAAQMEQCSVEALQHWEQASELLRSEVEALPRFVELTSKAPVIAGVVLSCKWYSHVLWLLGQQDDLDLMPGEQSSLLVGSDGTPPTNQWVGHIVSCMVNRLRDVMVADGLSVEEEEDTSMHCADLPPWHAVARRATHLVEQWVGLGASLSSTSMVLLRLCRRIPFLFACLSGLTRCACMFPNYSEPLYQLAQFCQRQGLDQECSQLLAGPLPEAFLQGKDRPTPPLQMKGNIFGNLWKLPVRDLSLPGAFLTHAALLLDLLVEVLSSQADIEGLTFILQQIKGRPEAARQYMRECDRTRIACKALESGVQCLARSVNRDTGARSEVTAETVQLVKKAQLLRITATKLKGVSPKALEEIKTCLKYLPTKDDVVRWRAEQSAGPSATQEELPASNTGTQDNGD